MKFEFKNFNENLPDFMRSVGYHYDGADPKTKELRFYKTLSGGLYPRFHIYGTWNRAGKKAALSLHLDQKAPVYEGATAHAGDYEGPVIENEVGRIREAFAVKNLPKMRPIE